MIKVDFAFGGYKPCSFCAKYTASGFEAKDFTYEGKTHIRFWHFVCVECAQIHNIEEIPGVTASWTYVNY